MTAATKDIKTAQFGSVDEVIPGLLNYPVEANTILYAGTMAALNAAGNAVPASASTALKLAGRVERQVDNRTSNVPFGAAGDQSVQVKTGVFFFNNASGANAVGVANLFKYCFASDDNTVSAGAQAGTLPVAGVVMALGSRVSPAVDSGKIAVWVGGTTPYDVNPLLLTSTSSAFKARGVGPATNVADLTTFTVAGNDGLTYAAGDVVFLYAQTAGAQNGPHVVGTVGGGTAPLTRPDWWPTGATIPAGTTVSVKAGTLFALSTWKVTSATDIVVGTNDPLVFPRYVCQQAVLVAGTVTLANVPIKSATKSMIGINRTTANTTASTIQYNPSTITPGAVGTASLVVQAQVAAGTINVADISTLNVSVTNF